MEWRECVWGHGSVCEGVERRGERTRWWWWMCVCAMEERGEERDNGEERRCGNGWSVSGAEMASNSSGARVEWREQVWGHLATRTRAWSGEERACTMVVNAHVFAVRAVEERGEESVRGVERGGLETARGE